jgi:hypothetical protein
MSATNLEPIHNLTYAYKAPDEDKFYIKHYRDWSYEEMTKSDDSAIQTLRGRIEGGQVHLMFTLQNIADMADLLKRIYKSQFHKEGKLDYKLFLQLLDVSLKYEDYRDYGKSLTGFRTVCNQFDQQLTELWKKALIV